MKQCTVGIALVASMLVTLAAAGANPDSRNGATWYWRAIDRLDRIDRRDWEIIDRYRADPSAGPTNELRAVLARSGPMLELFRRGTRQPYADFDLDWSQGFELRLPHLGRLRKITRVAQADALVHLADGNGAGAAMRIASIYGLADHFESDRIMISSLLGRAIFDTAEETAQAGFDRAVFDKLSAETLLRAVRRIDSGDPFGFVESVAGEQEMAVSWIGDRFAAQEDRADMLDAFWLDPDPEMSEQIGAMTDEEFVEGLETYDRMMDRIVLAFENPDMEAGRAARVEIEKEPEAGEHGLLARIFTPAFTFVHDQMKDAREHVRVRREMLEGIVQGEIALQQHANAAWYYARAFEKLRGEPPFPLDELFAVAIDEARPIGDRLAARLDTSTPVVDLLREGSVLARCDFSGLRPRGMQRLCPDDLAGMRDLLCLLLVDARRLLARGEREEEVAATIAAAADRLAICYRIVAHLGGDDAMLSALVAHDAFRRTHAIVEGAFEAGAFGETHRATLFAAADRIARKDPFGYINSVVAGRQMLVTLAGKQIVTEARAKELRERVRIADGEQILHVLAVHDTMIRASHRVPPDTTPSLDPLDRMDGIISRPALDAVRSYVPRVGPQIARGAIDFYCGREIPTIGRVAARRQRARSDLRDGLRRLKPPAPAASTPPAASTRDPGPSPAQPTPAERTGSR